MRININRQIIYIAIIFAFLSCKSRNESGKIYLNKDSVSRILSNDYKSALEIFPENLTDHFPANLDTSFIGLTDILSPEIGIVRLDLTSKFTDEQQFNNYFDRSIAIYSAEDTCLMVGHRKATRENYLPVNSIDSTNLKLLDLCSNELYPIPNFWQNDFTNDLTSCRLDPDFQIMVIEAKPGIYADNQYLSDMVDFPSEWKHGFSRGVAISKQKQIIIYWIMLW